MSTKIKMLAVAVAAGSVFVATSASALTAKKGAKCSATVSKALDKFVLSKVKIVSKVLTAIESKCLLKPPGDIPTCKDAAVFGLAGKIAKLEAKKFATILKCGTALADPDFLDNSNPNNPAKLAYINEEADCLSEGVDIVNTVIDGNGSPQVCTNKKTAGNLCTVATDCDSAPGAGDGVCTSVNEGMAWAVCIDRRLERKVEDIIKEIHPRAFALLLSLLDTAELPPVAIIPNVLKYVPMGYHLVNGSTNATIVTGGAVIPVGPISTQLQVNVGELDSNLTAEVTVPAGSVQFSPVFLPISGGITVCIDQIGDGQGVLCCNPAGCGGPLGQRDYDVCQDHDNSGLNTVDLDGPGPIPPLPLLPGECPGLAADPACTASTINQVSVLPADGSTACLEDQPKPSACNDGDTGTLNPTAHYPKCTGGTEPANWPCDLGAVVPADTCGPGATACHAKITSGPATGAPYTCAAPPCRLCNSPVSVTAGATAFGNGDMAVAQTIQFTLHSHLLDLVNYGAGCSNTNGDMIPDGFGCDGLPCTDDDTTPPNDPAGIALTTGTASAAVFDANGYPTASGGLLAPAAVSGAPASCTDLSVSVTAGIGLAGAFTGLDNSAFGDSVTTVQMSW